MIDRIVIENFKSLRKVDLSLGRLNLFIGANASGKSNFLDALRVLQGIGNGFTIGEILDGKPRSATSEVWDGIRGGSSNACFAGTETDGAAVQREPSADELTIQVHGRAERPFARPWEFVADSIPVSDPRLKMLDSWPDWTLVVTFCPANGLITRERYDLEQHTVYELSAGASSDHSSARYCSGQPGEMGGFPVDRHRPALRQFEALYAKRLFDDCPREHPQLAAMTAELLANTQRVDPGPSLLRAYSDAHRARRMGDHGENFAALVHTLCQDQETKQAYLSWLQELRPEEVSDVGVLRGALGEPLFMLREGNREVPAPVLSDGTLRFAALAAAFFQPDMPQIMRVEEIENGVHPSRLRLLMELFRSQAEHTGTQVFATTHSPLVLAWLQEEEYKTTFFCRRNEQTGESEIRPLTDVPRLMDVLGKPGQHLEDLFAEGWLEAAL